MGIEGFHSWLKNTYYSAISEYNNNSYDHIYIDLNFILHKVITYATSDSDLIERAIDTLNNIILRNAPMKTLNLAADGAASYAKIILQKKRRMQSSYKNGVNPMKLTPGTDFMTIFGNEIRKYANTIMDNKKIIVNTNLSDEPDESEFKICRMMQYNAHTVFDSHLIISNDADTILIAMAQKNMYNIDVLIGNTGSNYIISIDALIEKHMDMYGYNLNKRMDFVFVSLLNGNDYFPKLKCASFEKLWYTYKKIVSINETIISSECVINIELFIKFLFELSQKVPEKKSDTSLINICDANVKNYVNGIHWCMALYSSGEYITYDYMYSGGSIHPMCILLYLVSHNIKTIGLKSQSYTKIPSNIYPVIVMPYFAKDLIPKKYHSLINGKLKYMYDEEFCDQCKKFKEHYNSTETDNEYSANKYIEHRKTHAINDPKQYIDNIVSICLDI